MHLITSQHCYWMYSKQKFWLRWTKNSNMHLRQIQLMNIIETWNGCPLMNTFDTYPSLLINFQSQRYKLQQQFKKATCEKVLYCRHVNASRRSSALKVTWITPSIYVCFKHDLLHKIPVLSGIEHIVYHQYPILINKTHSL